MKFCKCSADIRMSLILSGVAAILLGIILSVFCLIIKNKNKDLVIQNAKSRQVNFALSIDKMLSSVEVAIENQIPDVERNYQNKDALMSITRRIVETNDMIFGSSVAFAPYFMKSNGEYYMVYSYRDGRGGIRQKELGGDAYNYFYMDWFQIPRLLKKNYWSEPFFDMGGGNMLMVTYSRPLYGHNGEFIGMVTADISLSWLNKMVLGKDCSRGYYSFLLSRNGYYLVHPNQDRVMNETVFSATMDMQDPIVQNIGERMLSGKTDYQKFFNGDTLSYIIFSGVPRTGWSLGTVCDEKILFKEFRHTAWTIVMLGLSSMVIQTMLIFWVVRRMYRKSRSGSKSHE